MYRAHREFEQSQQCNYEGEKMLMRSDSSRFKLEGDDDAFVARLTGESRGERSLTPHSTY